MRYPLFHYLGGLLWWIIIKFCKTDLQEEQGENNWARNVFFMIVIIIILSFIAIKFF